MSLRLSSEAEIDALQAVCQRLGGFDRRVTLEWLDGYLCALAAGPLVPALDEALAHALEDAWGRTFADPADAEQAYATVAARWRVLLSQLDPDALATDTESQRLVPLTLLPDEHDRDWLEGSEWAQGFLDAVADPRWGWAQTEADEWRDEAMAAIEALRPGATGEAGEGDAPASRDQLIDAAAFAVQDLRLWWVQNGPRTAPRHAESRPGRNDPCPCGSGKKYKKCHGAA